MIELQTEAVTVTIFILHKKTGIIFPAGVYIQGGGPTFHWIEVENKLCAKHAGLHILTLSCVMRLSQHF